MEYADTIYCCFPPKVIGGELQDRLIAVPYSKSATDQAIRVVNAFRSGLDTRNNPSTSSSFTKRTSTLTGLSAAASAPKRPSSTTTESLSDNNSQRKDNSSKAKTATDIAERQSVETAV
ncbi:uncharacterized protein [Parasteatoda tepidariorum]|uniref:uncharacterized protein n=1 Tax=Parasteatoda tepidariorum TaxID=114398 RepID=UPI0039BC550C